MPQNYQRQLQNLFLSNLSKNKHNNIFAFLQHRTFQNIKQIMQLDNDCLDYSDKEANINKLFNYSTQIVGELGDKVQPANTHESKKMCEYSETLKIRSCEIVFLRLETHPVAGSFLKVCQRTVALEVRFIELN